jgi:hypothetical protein
VPLLKNQIATRKLLKKKYEARLTLNAALFFANSHNCWSLTSCVELLVNVDGEVICSIVIIFFIVFYVLKVQVCDATMMSNALKLAT